MTVICRATPHKKPINTHIAPTVYGITVSRKNNPNQPIANIANVFSDFIAAELFCRMINENSVDELHFHDILEDTLASS